MLSLPFPGATRSSLIEAPPPLTFRGQQGGALKHPGEFLEEKQVTEANKCQNEFQGNLLR